MEPSQISKMELFAKKAVGFQSLTSSTQIFHLDIWLGTKYASLYNNVKGQWDMEQNDVLKF